MRRLLLVTKRYVLDSYLVARIDQRVIRVPALAEHLRDAFLPEAFGDKHRSIHFAALLRQADRDKAFFGHFAHCVLRTFPADAAVLDPGKRHQVDTAARWLVDMHDPDMQAARGRHRPHDVAREQPGGQTERR